MCKHERLEVRAERSLHRFQSRETSRSMAESLGVTAPNVIIKTYAHSHLGNDLVMEFSPQAGVCSVAFPQQQMRALGALMPQLRGNQQCPSVLCVPFLQLIFCGSLNVESRWQLWILTSQIFTGQGCPQHVAMRIWVGSGYSRN